MKLSMMAGYSPAQMSLPMDTILEAEKLGYDCVWTAEAYGSDAVSPAAWILAQTTKIKVGTAIMQMPARAPAMTAMTAMTLDALSGGRFVIGLGPSGAQVVEGWYGVPYGKPLTRTREYVEIIRKILKREEKLTHEGEHYSIPNTGPGTTGMGKPLKSILHGRPDMKIYTAAISPNGVRCAAEVADGFFPLWMNPERFDVFEEYIQEGFAKSGTNKTLDDFDVAPMVTVIPGDDLDQCRVPVKAMLSLYIGGMGSRKKNFYNDYASRMGYEAEAKQIQDLFLDGKKKEALAAVPDKLVDEIALVGPADRIRDRLGAWKDASAKGHVGTLLVGGGIEGIRLLAEEVL
jgi:F420-dependent oxidoreductase-like protein